MDKCICYVMKCCIGVGVAASQPRVTTPSSQTVLDRKGELRDDSTGHLCIKLMGNPICVKSIKTCVGG